MKPPDANISDLVLTPYRELQWPETKPGMHARALKQLGRAAKVAEDKDKGFALSVLGEWLRKPEESLCRAAAEGLVRLGSLAVPVLIGALGDDGVQVRASAAWALGEIGTVGGDVVPALIGAIQKALAEIALANGEGKRHSQGEEVAEAANQTRDRLPELEPRPQQEPPAPLESHGRSLPLPMEFGQLLFAGLSTDKEKRLIDLAEKLDGYRAAIREKLEKAIREYLADFKPVNETEKEAVPPDQKQRSIDIINGLLARLNFAIECKGQLCNLVLDVTTSHRQGQVRLYRKGTNQKLESSAFLSRFSHIRIVDAISPSPSQPGKPAAESTDSWSERLIRPQQSTPGHSTSD